MKILVLAGGYDQIVLIQELKKRNNYVYLADYLEDAPAKEYADRFFCTSTLDIEAIYDISKKEHIELIITACTDQALLTMAYVSEKLELSCYLSYESALEVTNKSYMKKKLEEHGILTPKFLILDNPENYQNQIESYNDFPAIVKPCDCNSSKGVLKVNSFKDLKKAVGKAFSLSRHGEVIIEQYFEGKEISIDLWRNNEECKILSITFSEKMQEKENQFIIYKSKYPTNMRENLVKKVLKIANDICEAFKLKNCPLLIQAVVTGEDIYVVEFSARMGGGTKYKLIENISGIDIMSVFINRVLENSEQVVNPICSCKNYEMNYIYANLGIVGSFMGFEELVEQGVIREIYYYKSIGHRVTKMDSSSDRILGLLIEGESESEIRKKREKILKYTDIKDVYGHSIMYKRCYENE